MLTLKSTKECVEKGQINPWSRTDKFRSHPHFAFSYLPFMNLGFYVMLILFHLGFVVQQVINNDRGVHMRPMPGMMGFATSTSKVISSVFRPS